MPTSNASATILFNPPAYGSYTEGFKCSARYCKHVASALVNAAPPDADRDEKKALAVLVEVADEFAPLVNERMLGAAVRPALDTFRECWGGLHGGLVAKSRLPAKMSDLGERAERMLALVFSDGLSFTGLDARAAWVEGDRIFHLVEERELVDELAELVGPEPFDAAKKATIELREAVGAGRTPREVPNRTAVQTTLIRFSRAVSRYARLLAAKVDEEDPRSVDRFLRAVSPLDEYRAARVGKEIVEDDDDLPGEEPPAPAPVPVVVGPTEPTPTT